MSEQPKAPCFAADGKEPVINAGFGYPLMVSAVAFNRQHSRIEADEALMREMREDVIWAFGELNGIDVADDNNCMKATLAALGKVDTALRKRLESSNAS